MPTLAKPCPACQRDGALKTTADGRVTCAACGKAFRVRSASAVPLVPSLLERATLVTSNDGVSAVPLEPLGPEPMPAGYTLLGGVSYACLVFGTATAIYQFGCMFSSGFLTPLGSLTMMGSGLLGVASNVLVGLLLVQAVKHLTRLDRHASWLAWRSGGLREPLGLPPGSNLPYLLPQCVAGGLLVIVGVATIAGETILPSGLTSWMILAYGIVLFLCGLALAEVRRFLWRMSMLGRALVKRSRGEELGLGLPSPQRVDASSKAASVLIRTAMILLLVAYAMAFMMAVIMYSQKLMPILGVGGALFLAIVGGSYALYRLTNLWRETLDGWRQAEPTNSGKPAKPPVVDRTARVYLIATLIVGGLLILEGAYFVFLSFMSLSGVGAGVLGVMIPMAVLFAVGAMACILGWLGFLKKGACQFVRISATLSRARGGGVRGQPLTRRLAVGLLCVVAVHSFFVLTSMLSLASPFMQMGFEFLMTMGLAVLTQLSLSILPLCWWALVCLDLDRAAANVEACRELKQPA